MQKQPFCNCFGLLDTPKQLNSYRAMPVLQHKQTCLIRWLASRTAAQIAVAVHGGGPNDFHTPAQRIGAHRPKAAQACMHLSAALSEASELASYVLATGLTFHIWQKV